VSSISYLDVALLTVSRALFSLLDFLVGGAIGFIAVFFAVRTLYGSIRVD